MAIAGAFFTTYEGTKAILHSLNDNLGSSQAPLVPAPFIHAAASSAGELVSCLILTPAEVLKQNAQMVKKSASSSSNAFDKNATVEAFRKFQHPTQLWRGYTALVARNLPFTAMQFPMFEYLKKSILDYRQRRGISRGTLLEKGIITAISAGSAGSMAAVITTPIDVVKTRIMLSAAHGQGRSHKMIHQGASQAKNWHVEVEKPQSAAQGGRANGLAIGREIFRVEGVKGLFKGGLLRGAWTAMGSGLYLGVYESGRTYLENRRMHNGSGPAIG